MNDSRQPKGVPSGGQFAPRDRDDAGPNLVEANDEPGEINPVIAAYFASSSPPDRWLRAIADVHEQELPMDGEYPETMIEILDSIGMWDESSQSAMGYSDQHDEPEVWAGRMAILDAAAASLITEQARVTS